MSGWIKIHRSIIDHWLYTENRVFSKFEAWNDILLNVNYAKATILIKGKLYTINRGESIMSLETWGKRWKWDKSKVNRFFKLLQKDKMIIVKGDTITTHITVCNYESYQTERNADETRTKRTRNADETHAKPIKEEEERKEEKEEEEIRESNKYETTLLNCKEIATKDLQWIERNNPTEKEFKEFIDLLIDRGDTEKTPKDFKSHFSNWKKGKKEEKTEPLKHLKI